MATETWLPMIDKRRCTGCGACVTNCPTGALALVGKLAVVTRPDACTYCVRCESVCQEDAVSLPYQIVLEREAPLL